MRRGRPSLNAATSPTTSRTVQLPLALPPPPPPPPSAVGPASSGPSPSTLFRVFRPCSSSTTNTITNTARYSLVVDDHHAFDAHAPPPPATPTPSTGSHVMQTLSLSSTSSQTLRGNGVEKEATGSVTSGPAATVMSPSMMSSRFPSVARTTWSEGLLMLLLVVLPIALSLTLVTCWAVHSRQTLHHVSERNQLVQHQLLQIGKLIVDFNNERELSVIYAVARSADAQTALRPFVQRAAAVTDRTLSELAVWPAAIDRDDVVSSPSRGSQATGRTGGGSPAETPMIVSPTVLRSPGLLAAVLAKHRTALIETGGGSGNFWDEIEFYTEIVDGLIGWLYGGMKRLRRYDDVTGLWPWLHAYGYLMATTNSLGAEQALCRAFHSVVCFSRRETLAYANYSFAAETLFRLYRLASATLPPETLQYRKHGEHSTAERYGNVDHDNHENIEEVDGTDIDDVDEWTDSSSSSSSIDSLYSAPDLHLQYSKMFPALVACRREIIDDLDHYGMAIDPSLCDYGRKNESEVHETDRLTINERTSLTSRLEVEMAKELERSQRWYSASVVALASIGVYATVALTLRCACIMCTAAAENTRRSRCCRHRLKHHGGGDHRGSQTIHDGPMSGTDGRHQRRTGSVGCRLKRDADDVISDRKWTSSDNWREDVLLTASAATASTGNGLSALDSFCNADATTTLTTDPRRTRHRVVTAAAATAITMETVKNNGNANTMRSSGDRTGTTERCKSTSYGDFVVAAAALSAAAGTDGEMNDLHQTVLNGPMTSDYCDHHRVFISRH